MIIAMIAAVAANGVIGKDNDLVWHLPDDMKFFQDKTKGHHVIMGRKNYDSLPPKFKPLPNRTNIIVTRQKGYTVEGCLVVNSLEEALKICSNNGEGEAFIIGGGEIYKMGFQYADRIYLTEIIKSYDGDTLFPEFNKKGWKEISREHHSVDARHEAAFDFVVYEKI